VLWAILPLPPQILLPTFGNMDDGYDADLAGIKALATNDEAIGRIVDASRSGWQADFAIPAQVFGNSAAAAELSAAYQAVEGSADLAVRDMAAELFDAGTELKLIAARYQSLDEDAARAYLAAVNRDEDVV
jgi:hypothetical protein